MVKEVYEEYVEIMHSNVQDQVLSVAGESDKPSNKSKVSKFDKLTGGGALQSVSKSRHITAVSNDEMRSTSDKVAFHTEIVDSYVEDSSASTTNRQGATHLIDKEPVNVSLGNSRTIPGSSIYEDGTNMDFNVQIPFRAAPLSNRERLMLRKQALKMRKRPVLAVGRNNIVTGVARTIMTHFKKHPLAIVNIKGRAKGTSVQEIIFQLEQATGAVLVSREPNKVILYRGWGDGELWGVKEPDARKKSTTAKGAGSLQLMAAIKLECGLQTD